MLSKAVLVRRGQQSQAFARVRQRPRRLLLSRSSVRQTTTGGGSGPGWVMGRIVDGSFSGTTTRTRVYAATATTRGGRWISATAPGAHSHQERVDPIQDRLRASALRDGEEQGDEEAVEGGNDLENHCDDGSNERQQRAVRVGETGSDYPRHDSSSPSSTSFATSHNTSTTTIQEIAAAKLMANMTRFVERIVRKRQRKQERSNRYFEQRRQQEPNGEAYDPPSSAHPVVTSHVSPQKVREAILYWMSSPVRAIVERRVGGGDDRPALDRALQLIDWSRTCRVAAGAGAGTASQQLRPLMFHRVVDPGTLMRLLILTVSVTSRSASMEELLDRLQMASHACRLLEEWITTSTPPSSSTPPGRDGGSSTSSSLNRDLNSLTLLRARAVLWDRRIHFVTNVAPGSVRAAVKKRNRLRRWQLRDQEGEEEEGEGKDADEEIEGAIDEQRDATDDLDGLLGDPESFLSVLDGLAEQAFLHQSSLLPRQLDPDDLSPEGDILLSVYQSILSSYAHMGAVSEAREFLARVESLEPRVALTIQHYNFVLLAYSHRSTRRRDSGTSDDSSRDPTAMERHRAESRRDALEFWRRNITGSSLERYHPVTMSILLKLLSDNPQEAMDFLESIPEPTVVHYNSVLTSWAKWADQATVASQQAHQILNRMRERGISPDRISYTAVMDALLKSNDRTSLDQVEQLLLQSRQVSSIDTAMYLVILRGMLQYHRRHVESQVREDVCLRMHAMLQQMLDQRDIKVTVDTYKLVLQAWATSHSPMAAEKAVQLLQIIRDRGAVADLETLDLVLRSLSIKVTASDEWTLRQANAVREYASQHRLKETPEFFSQYLRTVSRCGHVEEAESLLSATPLVDEVSYFAIVEGHAKQPNGAPKADTLMREWNGPPSLRMMKAVMIAWSYHPDDDKSVSPQERIDEIFEDAKRSSDGRPMPAYFLGAYMKAISKRPNAPVLMEKVLAKMQHDYDQFQKKSIKPNASNFATVIDAWAAVSSVTEGAAERAETILNRLDQLHRGDVDLKPTLACYRGVITAWALSNHPESGRRALAILERLAQQPGLVPNRSCFYFTLKAIGKSADPNRAQAAFDTLQRMKDSFASGNQRAEPTVQEYTCAIRAIGSVAGSFDARAKAHILAEEVVMDFIRNVARHSASLTSQHLDECEQLFLQYLWATFKLLPAGAPRNETVQKIMVHCPREVAKKPSIQLALAKTMSLRQSLAY